MNNADKTHQFTDCGIEFHSSYHCSKVLNDILKNGLSLNQFEAKYKQLAKSQIVTPNKGFKSAVQYNLKTDLWGPKEFVGVLRQGDDYDACISYGIREAGEFISVDGFLKENYRVSIVHDKPGFRIFSVNFPLIAGSKREMMISLTRPNEQGSMITLMFNH